MVRDGPMWDPTIWENIREAMHEIAERATACRHLLPRVVTDPERTTITVDTFDAGTGEVAQNRTVAIVKFDAQFTLSGQQVEREDVLHEGRAAAVALATRLAQAEEALLLFSERQTDPEVPAGSALAVRWPGTNIVTLRDGAVEPGLMIGGLESVSVPRTAPGQPYGQNTVAAVEAAIARLRQNDHYGPYAVVLSPAVYADTKTPIPNSLVQPYELIARDVAEIRHSRVISPVPPPASGADAGLVVSVGGNSMDLVLPDERYQIAFHQIDPNGLYIFRVSHRLALRRKRDNAVVRLDFE